MLCSGGEPSFRMRFSLISHRAVAQYVYYVLLCDTVAVRLVPVEARPAHVDECVCRLAVFESTVNGELVHLFAEDFELLLVEETVARCIC